MTSGGPQTRLDDLRALMGGPDLTILRLLVHDTRKPSAIASAISVACDGDLNEMGLSPLPDEELEPAFHQYLEFAAAKNADAPDPNTFKGRKEGNKRMAKAIKELIQYLGHGNSDRSIYALVNCCLSGGTYEFAQVEAAWPHGTDYRAAAAVTRWALAASLGLLAQPDKTQRQLSYEDANQLIVEDAGWSAAENTNGPFILAAEWTSLPWSLACLEEGRGLLPFTPSYVPGFRRGTGVKMAGRLDDMRALVAAVKSTAEKLGMTGHEVATVARMSPYLLHMKREPQSKAERETWEANDRVMRTLFHEVTVAALNARGPVSLLWEKITEALDQEDDGRSDRYWAELLDKAQLRR